jgi:hypothetical protein
MVPPGTPRAAYTAGRHSPRVGAAGARADAAAAFGAGGADPSAEALVGWEAAGPRAAAAAGGGGGAGGGGSGTAARLALARSLPPPLALLRPSAPAATLVSRGSREGVTPRSRASKLDDVLGALVASRGGNGLAPRSRGSGSVAVYSPGASALSSSSQQLPSPMPPATPGDAARAAAAAAAAEPFARRAGAGAPPSPGKSPSRARGGGFGSGGAAANYSFMNSEESASGGGGGRGGGGGGGGGTPSPRALSARSGGTGATPRTAGSPRPHPSEILVGPASVRDASGVLRGVTRADAVERVAGLRSPGLVRMRSGEEVVKLAAVQARAMYRLHAHWDVDLTHNFVSAGEWAAMNFTGRTQAAGRYAAVAAPEGARAGRSPPQQQQPAAAGSGGRPASGFAPPPHEPTALGAALQAREAAAFGAAAPPPTPLRAAAAAAAPRGGPSPPPPPPPAGEAAVGARLAAWEVAHAGALHAPEGLPKRELRDKIWASGVAPALGFASRARLDECGNKAALLTALHRIPATKRMAALYEGGRGWATLPAREELPQSTWSRATFAGGAQRQ